MYSQHPPEVEKSLRLGNAGVAWGYVLSAVWSERKNERKEAASVGKGGKHPEKLWTNGFASRNGDLRIVCQLNMEFTDGGWKLGPRFGLMLPTTVSSWHPKVSENWWKSLGHVFLVPKWWSIRASNIFRLEDICVFIYIIYLSIFPYIYIYLFISIYLHLHLHLSLSLSIYTYIHIYIYA